MNPALIETRVRVRVKNRILKCNRNLYLVKIVKAVWFKNKMDFNHRNIKIFHALSIQLMVFLLLMILSKVLKKFWICLRMKTNLQKIQMFKTISILIYSWLILILMKIKWIQFKSLKDRISQNRNKSIKKINISFKDLNFNTKKNWLHQISKSVLMIMIWTLKY